MECNKDEALRAKSIADTKLEKKDFAGAKKFALKAQTLYPGLENISQMLTTLDVYISAENKINGEIDWYRVLGLDPSADDESIRKSYRKFALMLHPDKNKSTGAEGAFKLISEAWSLLSDKVKRSVYNQRRGCYNKGVQMKAPTQNGFFNISKSKKVPSATVPPTPAPTQINQRTDTFWTICHRCKMHYEYLKAYLNQTLLCPNCQEAFIASKTDPPINFSKSSNENDFNLGSNASSSQKPGPRQTNSSNLFKNANHQVLFPGTGGVGRPGTAEAGTPGPAKSSTSAQQAFDKLKRPFPESQTSTQWEDYLKKRKVDENSQYGTKNNYTVLGNGGFASATGSKIYGFSGNYRYIPPSSREMTALETRNMLMGKSREEISKKINEWRSEKTISDRDKVNAKEHKKEKHNVPEQNQSDDLTLSSMTVPDPDFHDFDQDRTESSFGDNEVWAAYDDNDGMPRFYALISKVISKKPFKLRISWLSSKTNSEFSPKIDWVGSGFYKTSGEFRVTKYEICKSINAFSQKVNNWSKNSRGSILIFPQKGDVWALYENWSPDWNFNTPDEIINKYNMVMVLDDYNEEKGVSVVPLEKVVGFKTVFRLNLEKDKVKKIPKEEMFRFSHRVPNNPMMGEKDRNVPEGCLELDPAATPLELLKVIKEDDREIKG